MNDRTFTVTMTEDERLMNLAALGFASVRLPQGEPATLINGLIAKLQKIPATPSDPDNGNFSRNLAGPSKPKPFVDYFARDRKGNIQTGPPEGAELQTIKILQAAEKASTTVGKAPFLQVLFNGAIGKANCFDALLWPLIVKQTGQEAALYFVKAGNYWNIVGVRA
jgi:hypothetical protein